MRSFLERDVVVGGRRTEVGISLRRRRRGNVLRLAAALAAAEELHRVGDHLDGLALRAVLRLPLAPLEPAVDADGAPLREVLRAVLALVSPDGDVEVVGLFRPLARGAVLAARVDREPQAAYRHAARRVPELGVAREVADQDDAVDVGHFSLPLLLLFLLLLRTLARLRTPARTNVRGSVLGLPAGALDRLRARTPRTMSPLDAARGQVPHHAVGDLQDPRQLVERLRLGVELQQVVDPVRLLLDLIGELAPPPRIVPDPRAAAILDQLAGPRDDLVLTRLWQIGIEHEQDLVIVSQPLPPSVWSAPPGLRCGAGVRGRVASGRGSTVRVAGRRRGCVRDVAVAAAQAEACLGDRARSCRRAAREARGVARARRRARRVRGGRDSRRRGGSRRAPPFGARPGPRADRRAARRIALLRFGGLICALGSPHERNSA